MDATGRRAKRIGRLEVAPQLRWTPRGAHLTIFTAWQHVYKVFDLDGSGEVGFDELFVLGTARRELRHKGGVWTSEKNERVMELIGRDATGDVPMGNFSAFFEECLPIDQAEFEVPVTAN